MQTEISNASLEEIKTQTLSIQNKTSELVIKDSEDLDTAKKIEKECTTLEKFIESERKRYTDPLNEVVKKLIQKEKDLMAPITKAKEDIRNKQIAFAQKQEQERLRQEGIILDIIQKINSTPDDIDLELLSDTITEKDARIGVAIETRRQFFAEQERLAEFARKQKEAQEELDRVRQEQWVEAAKLAKQKLEDDLARQKMEDETARILEDGKRQEMKEQADAEQKRVAGSYSMPKGMRKVAKFEIVNDKLVPVEFYTIDESKIKEAIKNWIREIPWVRVWEEDKIQ